MEQVFTDGGVTQQEVLFGESRLLRRGVVLHGGGRFGRRGLDLTGGQPTHEHRVVDGVDLRQSQLVREPEGDLVPLVSAERVLPFDVPAVRPTNSHQGRDRSALSRHGAA